MTSEIPKYFAIFGTMRCGSNLLESALDQFEHITCYGELFNHAFIGDYTETEKFGIDLKERAKNPLRLLELAIADANGSIPGFRIFNGHDQRVADHVLTDPTCAKIILRRDALESFVSLKIAQKTDQWLLHDAKDRKAAQIHFDPEEFKEYREKLDDFYDDIQRKLQVSGQVGYWLQYPDQKDVDIINGIAAWLGVSERVRKVEEPLKRQNPEPLSELVENSGDLLPFLADEDDRSTRSYSSPKVMKPNIPQMVSCLSAPILFSPIPGGPNQEVLRWMAAVDGADPIYHTIEDAVAEGLILHTGHSKRTLSEWMAAHPELITVTAVRHPVERAYQTFMDKIFRTGPNTYDAIRQHLVEHYDLDLPPVEYCDPAENKDLSDIGWEQKHHRTAFHQFLKFLKPNLMGQTSIRKDGLWTPQTDFIAAFNHAVSIHLILKEGELATGVHHIENTLELSPTPLPQPPLDEPLFKLSDIYTQQTENLVRKLYDADYIQLGFDAYHAALDA